MQTYASVRRTGVVGRWDEDEFAVISPETVAMAAHDLAKTIAESRRGSYAVVASADEALDRAKADGRRRASA